MFIQSTSINNNLNSNIWWILNNQESVLLQVIAWLKKVTSYTEKIPQLQEVGISGAYGLA